MNNFFKLIIVLTLMLAFCGVAMADTVSIGTGTSTTSYLPLYGLYGYNYTQQIFTQTQINTSGNITKIRFFYVSGAIANSKDWVIYMGHTDKETFATATDWVPLADLTQVFAGDVTNMVPAANNWMEITLTTPFNYNNTDNLVIAVDENTSGYASMSWGGFTSGTNTGIYYYNDTTNPDPASPPTATSRTATINRIQLVFPNSSAPLAPTLSEPANGGWAMTDALLKWQSTPGAGDANAYDVYFGTAANPPLVSSNQAENFYTPTLAANQKYYWKVMAKNEIGNSPASDIWSFNTPGANNLVESFEETTFPPPGWANPGTWSRSTSYKVHGTAGAYKYGSTSTQYILSTPRLTITNDSALNFWSYVTTATGTLQVVYSTDRVTWTQVGANITHAAASTWYNNNVDLSSLAGNNYYLGIRTGLQSASFYIDMVIGPEVTPEAPGAPTASLPADNATAQSVAPTFTWTGPTTGGVPTGYRLYLDTVDGSTLFADNITGLSYTPTALLDYETTYYWKMAAFNAMGEGPATTVRSFTTRDDPTIYTLPWTEDFEGTTFPPTNWARLTGLYPSETPATYTSGWMSANFANISTPPNKSARLNIYGTTIKYWLVTPPVAIPAGAYDLKFDLALTTYSGTNPVDPLQQLDDKFIVLISDSPMMTDATVLRQWDNAGSPYVYNEIAYLGESQIIDLSAYTGTKYIAFYGESTVTGGDNNVYVDNVTVRQTPALPIFSYSPDALNFGTLLQNNPSAWQNVTVTNDGAGIINLNAGNVSVIGTHASMFAVDTSNLPAALGTGESVTIPVRATLTAEGAISATMRMAYGGVNYDVALSAEGMPAGTVIIGDGIANLYMPVNAYYGYSYSQSIYRQGDIDMADKRIEKISYYWNGAGAGNNSNEWVVYMGHTEEETFASTSAWIPLSDLTPVYSGTLNIPATAGWITITLSNPFVYNNRDNLVIAVDENKAGYDSSTYFFFNTNTTGENRSIRAYSDTYNPDPANPPTSATQTTVAGYPNIMMILGDLPTAPIFSYSPAALDFGLMAQDVPTAWQNVTVSNTGAGTLNLAAANISFVGTDASMFEFDNVNLPATLAAGQSVIIPVRATITAEGAISATMRMVYGGANYDVELSAEGLPLGTVIIGDGVATQIKPFGTLWGYERSAALYTAEQVGLIGLVDSAAWYCNTTSTTSIPYKVYAGTTSATALTAQSWDNFKSTLTLVKEGTHVFSSTGWHTFEFDNPVMYGGGNLIVAVETNYGGSGGGSGHQFRYTTGATGSHMYWNVDTTPPTTLNGTLNTSRPNIMLHIEEPPEGEPAAPVMTYPADRATGLPVNGFNLSWNADIENGGVPEYYVVFMAQDEESIYDEYFFETENTYFNPVVEGGLELGYLETWYWYVQAINAHGEALAEEIFSFTTETDPRILSLPHAQNFDGVTTPNFPRAWTPVKTNTGSSLTTSSTYSHTPSNSVYMYNQTLTETMRLVTPEVVVPINSIKLSFQLRAGSTTNYSFKVGTVDTPDVDGVFTEIATITPTVSAAFEPHSVSFANYTGTDRYIAFQHGVGGTYQSLYLDTVLLEELMPIDMAATTLSAPGYGVAGTPFTFELGVYNNGTQPVSNYTIYLKSDNTVLTSRVITEALAADESAVHEIEWTPTLGGNYQIYAEVVANGDGNSSNNSTGIKNVLVFDSSMTMLPVGDEDSTLSSNSLPLNFYYKSSLSETLYYPEELHLLSGDITALILTNNFTSSTVLNKEIKIYMAETEAENLSAGWLTDEFVEVFNGNLDFPAGVNQIVIPLTTPFEYNGGTLAVRYNRVLDTQYHASTDRFFYTNTLEYPSRSRYMQSDTVEYDPEAPVAGGTLNAWLPNTTFVVSDADLQPHAKLEGYVRDAANNPIPEATVTLTDERYSTITDGTGYYSFTFWEVHTVSATASKPTYYSQTVTDIELLVGQTVTQNFTLQAMPRVTVSGIVKTNDIPGGVVGATITLHGDENHTVYSTANGAFSIPNVLGNTTGIPYTITVTYAGYDSYSGSTTVYGSAVNLGTITLIEKLWTAYNLVAERHVSGAELTWDAAEEPDYFFWDFEEDDGGWESGGYGDWEWGNTYPSGGTFNWTESPDSCVPPTAAYSGTGLWGTKLYTNYSNAGAWSYLTKTVDLAGFTNPQLRFWRWNNMFGDFDYWQVQVNGTMVLEEKVLSNAWVEKVVDLSAYTDQEVTIRFAAYATTVVAYAGLYIDDIYIGPPPADKSRYAEDRSLQGYNVYRMLADDEATPENWTLLQSGVTNTTYLDTGFATVPSGLYKWAVKANYTGDHTSPAVISNPLGVFGAPQNLAITALGNNVTLSWTPETGASYYVVYGADDPYATTWNVLGYTTSAGYTFNATNAPYKFFKVTAADGDMPSGRNR
ncbi:MAG: choice-of-anchor J domain-containing protein [Candidatus Cloacimonadaceae bacterium]